MHYLASDNSKGVVNLVKVLDKVGVPFSGAVVERQTRVVEVELDRLLGEEVQVFSDAPRHGGLPTTEREIVIFHVVVEPGKLQKKT